LNFPTPFADNVDEHNANRRWEQITHDSVSILVDHAPRWSVDLIFYWTRSLQLELGIFHLTKGLQKMMIEFKFNFYAHFII